MIHLCLAQCLLFGLWKQIFFGETKMLSKDGVLQLVLERSEGAKPRQIALTVDSLIYLKREGRGTKTP